MTTYSVNVLAHLNRDLTVEADTEAEAAHIVEQVCAAAYGTDLALADVQSVDEAEEQTIIGQSEVDLTALLADGTGLFRGPLDGGGDFIRVADTYFTPGSMLADVIVWTIDYPCSVQLDEMSDDGASGVAEACEALGMSYEEASDIRDALADRVRSAIEREIAAWRVEQGIDPDA
jgi:hypothetical protein